MAGLIAMTAILVVVGIEMFFATKGAGHAHSSDYTSLPRQKTRREHKLRPPRPTDKRHESFRHFELGHIRSCETHSDGDTPLKNQTKSAPLPTHVNGSFHTSSGSSDLPSVKTPDESDSDLDLEELDPVEDRSGLLEGQNDRHDSQTAEIGRGPLRQKRLHSSDEHHTESGGGREHRSEHQRQQKMLLQCLLLEAGILFHSVFIGMALSVATGTSFIVLLVAISFHQTFEGLALGSRIAAITIFPPYSSKPWLMALAYGTTTPIGQAIGLLMHELYDPYSQTGLLMVGVMNAISSGLLVFAGLVELLAEDFLSDASYGNLQGRSRLEACAAVIAGSAWA
ncbi:hypothetical protein LTR50_004252 [Elasticomyces elasticus]|nr:hypothetical protein LTR50_004252 [Elasticomyces elasticus]